MIKQKIVIIYILVSLSSSILLNGQDYFDRIIPFEFGNPNISELKLINDKFYITVIYGQVISGQAETSSKIIEIENDKYNYIDIDLNNFGIARKGIIEIEDNFLILGKDRLLLKGLKIAALDSNFDMNWLADIKTNGYYNFPANIIKLKDSAIALYSVKAGDIYKKWLGLSSYNSEGQLNWQKYFFDQDRFTTADEIIPSFDGSILLSTYTRFNDDPFYSKGTITKIDHNGNIIWLAKNEYDEPATYPTNLTQLSDTSIVQAFKSNKFNSTDGFWPDYYAFPTKLIWYDTNGNLLRYRWVRSEPNSELDFNQIVAGQSDYFFAVGYKDGVHNVAEGLITKFSNQGDTIWSHLYRHSGFDSPDFTHVLNDIYEFPNGDLLVAGLILDHEKHKSDIWLMKLNSEGCYTNEPCDEVLIVSSEEETGYLNEGVNIKLMPNPGSGQVHIKYNPELIIDYIEVFDLQGRMLKRIEVINLNSRSLDFSSLPSSTYFIHFKTENGSKIIKWQKV